MEKPHIYTSEEIAHAVSVGPGVDDHLRDNKFVKLSEYEEKLLENVENEPFTYQMFVGDSDAKAWKANYLNARREVDSLMKVCEKLARKLSEGNPWIDCADMMPPYGEFVNVLRPNGSVEVRCFDTEEETDDYDGHLYMLYGWYKEEEYTGDPEFRIDEYDVVKWMYISKPKPESDHALKAVGNAKREPFEGVSRDELVRMLVETNGIYGVSSTENTKLRNRLGDLCFLDTWYMRDKASPRMRGRLLIETKDGKYMIGKMKERDKDLKFVADYELTPTGKDNEYLEIAGRPSWMKRWKAFPDLDQDHPDKKYYF